MIPESIVNRFLESGGVSDSIEELANIIATLEYRQLEAVQELHAELGIDGAISVQKTREERAQQIEDLAKTAIGNRTLTEYWFEEVAPIQRPEKAAKYAGIDEDEWQRQIERWADAYRNHGADDSMSDRDLAARHVASTFDVDIETFEDEVIDFTQGQVLEAVLGGNFLAVESGIRSATTTIANTTDGDVDDE